MCFLTPTSTRRKGFKEPGGKGDRVERKYDDGQPLSLFVFKTLADPFAGRINYFKVKSGVLKNDATLTDFTRGSQERFQHIQVVQGKQLTEVAIFTPEISARSQKLKEVFTGEHAWRQSGAAFLQPAVIPEPSITLRWNRRRALTKTRSASASTKSWKRTARSDSYAIRRRRKFLLAGSGQQHIEVVVAKLHKRYHVDLTLSRPKFHTAKPSAQSRRGRQTQETIRRPRPVWSLPREI